MILEGEINDEKISSFSSDFQTLIKRYFLCIFNQLLMSLGSAHSGSLGSSRDPEVEACCSRGSRDSL